jgi:hypothetical protein
MRDIVELVGAGANGGGAGAETGANGGAVDAPVAVAGNGAGANGTA